MWDNCHAELCRNWGGHGCICEVMGIEPDVVQEEPLHYDDADRAFDTWAGMGDA